MYRVCATLLIMLLGQQLQAAQPGPWVVGETQHFRLHATDGASNIEQRSKLLEQYHALLARSTGGNLPANGSPLDVFLVDKLATAFPWRQAPGDMAGFYRADASRISAVAVVGGRASKSDLGGQEALFHEYAHHFLLGSNRVAYPAWYVEGFAEYFSSVAIKSNRYEVGRPLPLRTHALATLEWLPLERILERHPELGPGEARLFYAQSWLLAHYLFHTPGMRQRMMAYLRDYGRGIDPVEAFRTHVGPDIPDLERRLRDYFVAGPKWVSVALHRGEPVVRLVTLPPSASKLLMRYVALEHGLQPEEKHRALADIRRISELSPGDPYARRSLALAEMTMGDSSRAVQLLDGLLVEQPDDPQLLMWRAQLAHAGKTAAGDELALQMMSKASRIAPDDWRILHAYARLYRPASGSVPPEVLDRLLKAWRLAPQVSDIAFDTALALTHAGRMKDAATVLEPLAFSGHGAAAAGLGRKMLIGAQNGDSDMIMSEVMKYARPQER